MQVCYATMQRAALMRSWRDMHGGEYHDGSFRRWSKEPSEEFRFHRDDGVTLTVADYDDGSWDALLGSEASADGDEDAEQYEEHQ